MPVKGQTKRSQADIDKAVQRYLNGEPANVLAKYYGVSKPGFYLWVNKYKENALKRSKTAGMRPDDQEASSKQDLQLEVAALREQVKKLRNQLFDLMVSSGKL